jgi:hypothetical protein
MRDIDVDIAVKAWEISGDGKSWAKLGRNLGR